MVPIVAPPPARPLATIVDRMSRSLTRRSVVPVALALTALVAAGDLATGVEIPFTILYLLPIGLATWFRDRQFGLAISCVATACVVLTLVREYGVVALVWNSIGALALFIAIVWLLDQLHLRVAREAAERRVAVDQLRHAERLTLIGTLAAGVAHEIGTPLNVIAGCAELLAQGDDPAMLERRTTMILDQTVKISAIIRQLLHFGRRGGAARTAVELGAVVTAAAEMVSSTARKLHRSIQVELGDKLEVTGVAAELEQVVSNLILNGLQAMDRPGAVRVKTRCEHRVDGQGHAYLVACVRVEDDGRGIAASDVSRVFDPFFTTKGVGEGTGLGLSVSYGIVRDHGGTIEVESQPRCGSQFTVVLPLRT
jgi:signal transduction histidine kinase